MVDSFNLLSGHTYRGHLALKYSHTTSMLIERDLVSKFPLVASIYMYLHIIMRGELSQ